MKWISSELPTNDIIRHLSQSLQVDGKNFPLSLSNILVQRGIDTLEKASAFFRPSTSLLHDPMTMKDMDKAVDRVLAARTKGEKVLIYGDYDVDGTTSVTLMSLFFTDWGFDFEYYIPDRYKEGYGVSFAGIEYAHKIGAKLIISLDCGIKAVDKVKFAAQRGIDFIICDHHTPGAELPAAVAILDPLQEDCAYPCKDLPGCGVGLKLAQALNSALKTAGFEEPQTDYDPFELFCDLATLSIACDIVSITGENRVIAWHGLQKLRTDPLNGIKAIMSLSKNERKWDIGDLVFFVGPRINSAGRLGSAKDAVEVMLGKSSALEVLADDLHTANDERKTIDAETTAEALEMIEADTAYPQQSTTVLFKDTWHKGVIGIVASRLIEKHYRPTILFTQTEDKLVGSARSVNGFDIYNALEACSDYLVQFGGHKYAAGMTLKPENYQDFRNKFEEIVAKTILPEQKIPTLAIDYELDFREIDVDYIHLLQKLEPFGPGNPDLTFMTQNVKVEDARTLKETHIKLELSQNGIRFSAIGFGMAEKFWKMNVSTLNIAYALSLNTWRDKTSVQLMLKDFS